MEKSISGVYLSLRELEGLTKSVPLLEEQIQARKRIAQTRRFEYQKDELADECLVLLRWIHILNTI